MEIKVAGVYKKILGEFSVQVTKVTDKMVEFAVISAVNSVERYRLKKSNFNKYYCEVCSKIKE
jgi:hypothetical protein